MASRGIAVLTRDVERAAPYAVALAALGFDAIAMPVTRSVPVDPAALARAVAGDHDLIVVASARAAHALVAAGPFRGAVWAVGPATARVLADAGHVAHRPDVADAAGLASAILERHRARPLRILVPRAEDGRDEGIARLREAGAIVDDVVAYRTIATPSDDPEIAPGKALLASGDATVCAVFAPSQVAALAAIVPLAKLTVRFAAIGATTAEALAAAGITGVVVATEPTPDGLAAALG